MAADNIPFWVRAARAVAPVVLGVFLALAHGETVLGWSHGLIGMFFVALFFPLDRGAAAARFGWLLGLGYLGWTLRWIIEPFLVDVARHGWMAPFAIVLMAGGLALFWGFAFWAATRLGHKRSSAILWLPVTLGLAELVRGHVFTGFPWGLLSYTLIGTLGDIWFAWIGPYGTSVLLIAAPCLAAYSLKHRVIWGPALIAGIGAATIGLNVLVATTPLFTDTTVRLIQPNAPQHQKWDPALMPMFFDRAIGQTGAGDDVPDVVIWPETSVPALLDYADPWLEQMSLAARGAPVVAGIQRREAGSYYNSAILIDAPEGVAAISDKAHLVPFGEYIPFADILRPLGFGPLVDQVAGFSPGTGDGLMEIDGLGVARVLICYEGIFPEDMQRGSVRPDVLLIITNDAWFGTHAGPQQHLAQARARAIEQGLPVVRAANTGISAVIDARGRVVARLGLNTAGYVDATVPAALPVTMYAQMGDWPLAVLLIVFIAGGVARRRPIVIDAPQARG